MVPPGTISFPQSFIDLGSRTLFFDTRMVSELTWQPWIWSSDGTPEGTAPVAATSGDRVVFAADDGIHGLEVWVTDATPEGTHLAADVTAGRWPSSPREFTVFGDELFFNAGRPRTGYELWKLPLAATRDGSDLPRAGNDLTRLDPNRR